MRIRPTVIFGEWYWSRNRAVQYVDMNTYDQIWRGKFKVELDYQKLMNIDPITWHPSTGSSPRKKKLRLISPMLIASKLNLSEPVHLKTIRIEYRGHHQAGTVVTGELPLACEDYESVHCIPPTDINDHTLLVSPFPAGYFHFILCISRCYVHKNEYHLRI